MNQAPRNRGAFRKTTFYATNRRVALGEQVLNLLALNTPESACEDREVTRRRRTIESARQAYAHLSALGLTPILDSLDVQALEKEGFHE